MMTGMATLPTNRTYLGVAIYLALGACTFNTSNQVISDDGGGGSTGNDSGPRPDAIDPDECPDDIHIEIRVDGQSAPLGDSEPYIRTLVGDTVELSATGTCTRSGIIDFNWSVEPASNEVQSTALPDLKSEVISVYSKRPGPTNVRLVVSDGETSRQLAIFAFEAFGFEEVESYQGPRIRDLSAGAKFLWVGTNEEDAFRGDLDDLTSDYVLVSPTYDGVDLSSKMRVHEAAAGDYVWFSSADDEGQAYRLSLANSEIIAIDTIDNAKTREIDDAPTGIRLATDKGVALAADSASFIRERNDDSEALSFGPTGSWAGKDRLYPLPDGQEIDLFNNNDDIQCLADDGTALWIGRNNQGISTYFNNDIQDTYKKNNSNLTDNDVESIAIDTQQDVWVGTSGGVSRFKRDRQIWVPLTTESGLVGTNALDIDVIECDEASGRRAIYVGGRAGLFVMRTP